MRTLLAIGLITIVAGTALAQTVTDVQNGTNSATLTQSGDPATATRKVERRAGHTHIEQRSGTNSATITQDGPGSSSNRPDADPFFNDDDD